MARKRAEINTNIFGRKTQPPVESPKSTDKATVESEHQPSPPLDNDVVVAKFWEIVNAVELDEQGYIRQTGVGLRESELEALDEIANKLGIGRNSVIRYAVRVLLQMQEADVIKMTVTSTERKHRQTRRMITTK